MRHLSLVLAFTLLPCLSVRADPPPATKPLTFEQARSSRGFLQSIPSWRWRPGHAELVRVNTSGKGTQRKRQLVAMDAESGKQRVLLDLTALEGKVAAKRGRVRGIGRGGAPQVSWTKDGTGCCVLVKGHLAWANFSANETRVLTSFVEPISDVRLAPDGSAVAFCKDYEQWVVPTKEGAPYPLSTGGSELMRNAGLDWVYPEELGHSTGTWWAPDGSAVAVLQLDQTHVPEFSVPKVLSLHTKARTMRYPKAGDPNPKARLRVYPVEGQGDFVDVLLGDPAPEYIARVTWVPDSKRLMVVTLDRAQQTLQVHLCDAATGKGRVLFEEHDEAWLDVPLAPHFLDDVNYLWRTQTTKPLASWLLKTLGSKEPDVAVGSAALEAIWRPACDIENGYAFANVGLYPEFEEVVQVDLAGVEGPQPWKPPSVPKQANQSLRATWNDAVTHALVTWSSPDEPRSTALFRRDGTKLRDIGSGKGVRFDQVAWAQSEFGAVEIPGVKSGVVHWRLWKPADFDESKSYPLIVHTYAGPGSRMLRPGWPRGRLWTTFLTQRGFLVAQIDGRGSGGQSRAFTRLVRGCLGHCEIDDQARVAQELAKRPYVDGDRIGIWGWSYGGTMACNGVIFRGDVFKAAVAVAPVTDWRLYDTIYTERYMGRPQDNKKGYDESSVVKAAKRLNGHLLLVHGLADDNVHAQNTYRLMEALLKAKKTTFDVITYADRGHGIGGTANKDVYRRMVAWFEKHLKPD